MKYWETLNCMYGVAMVTSLCVYVANCYCFVQGPHSIAMEYMYVLY